MSVQVFSIAFSIVMIGMLIFVLMNIHALQVAKAGKVTKPCRATKRIFGYMPSFIKINGVKIDVSEDTQMLVCGNSMKEYRIFDGQRIYVKPLSENEKYNIQKFPVLALEIVDNPIENDAKFKLRKFVGYAPNEDWGCFYEAYRHKMKISKADFVQQCSKKYEKMQNRDKLPLAVSETYDEDRGGILYSLHPISVIYGKVEYAL